MHPKYIERQTNNIILSLLFRLTAPDREARLALNVQSSHIQANSYYEFAYSMIFMLYLWAMYVCSLFLFAVHFLINSEAGSFY